MERTCCYGVYERTSNGEWLYPWGDPVPGARDLTLGEVLRLGLMHDGSIISRDGLTDGLREDPLVDHRPPPVDEVDWEDHETLGRVVGLDAPELHVRAMLTIADIADMTGVAPDTIAAYRYRGYLPEPQAVIGRTPVWSRPIIRHWLKTRPGNGWRTDIYGDRAEYAERVQHMRAARQQRRRQETVA